MMTSRRAAIAVMTLAGTALAGLGVTAVVTDRVTGHEALSGLIALLAGIAAALWLRRNGGSHDRTH